MRLSLVVVVEEDFWTIGVPQKENKSVRKGRYKGEINREISYFVIDFHIIQFIDLDFFLSLFHIADQFSFCGTPIIPYKTDA